MPFTNSFYVAEARMVVIPMKCSDRGISPEKIQMVDTLKSKRKQEVVVVETRLFFQQKNNLFIRYIPFLGAKTHSKKQRQPKERCESP